MVSMQVTADPGLALFDGLHQSGTQAWMSADPGVIPEQLRSASWTCYPGFALFSLAG